MRRNLRCMDPARNAAMEPDHIAALHRTSRIVSSSMTLREMLQELVDLVVEAPVRAGS